MAKLSTNENRLPSSRRGWKLALLTAWLTLSLFQGGCQRRTDAPTVGTYRAVLELPGGAAPFGLHVARENEAHRLYLVNGGQRVAIDAVELAEGELRAQLPGSARLSAVIFPDRLEGTVTLAPRGSPTKPIPFRATLGATYRFYEQPATDNADVEGQWRVELTANGRQDVNGSATLEQRFDRVVGSIITATGRARTVEGQVNGDDVALSAFDGETVVLYKLRVDESGNLVGEYWQDLDGRGTLRASRDTNATL